jgi:short-subunit dehydrogenase
MPSMPMPTFLVNAAGVFLPKPFLEHTAADYDLYHNLNKATFFITQKVVQNLVERAKGGAIASIGSMWAKQAVQATPSSAYYMAKAGLHRWRARADMLFLRPWQTFE